MTGTLAPLLTGLLALVAEGFFDALSLLEVALVRGMVNVVVVVVVVVDVVEGGAFSPSAKKMKSM